MRQGVDEPEPDVRSYAVSHPGGWLGLPQDPAWSQLVYAVHGVLTVLPDAPLQLPTPRDPRAVAVAAALHGDPGDTSSVTALARRVGASRRSLERVFRAETGMTVRQWRRRLRMLVALRPLATGMTATAVAARVGYATPSAFGAAFRAELGATPAHWFSR
ncbi:helix-turn-helix domain-containing protein [Dactylosporangium sp. NBC_01737]|uniref:helix-turn-helix domain-containing protein n=1 Tax=Dactylosporangium sp. NBC_01737 TaxID=2975959 RepID=UPI002E15A4EF|nr:helix-turn-helix domain-containing protein [Dactylosporangium sp. NBC_01737]